MKKIPAGRTIAFAYSYLFGQIWTVISLTVLPALAVAAADYAARSAAIAVPEGEQPGGEVAFTALAALVVVIVAPSVAAVAVTRAVLAQDGAAPAAPFGATVLRMIAANIRFWICAIILLGLALGIILTADRLAGISIEAEAPTELNLSTVAAGLLSWVVSLYALISVLRMGFLLPAVVVAEEKGGLRRSHDLAEGNLWRLLGIWLALILPLALLMVGAAAAIMQAAFGPDFTPQAVTQEFFQRMQQAIGERLAAFEIFNAVIFVLYAGLMYSASAFAYRTAAPPPAKVKVR